MSCSVCIFTKIPILAQFASHPIFLLRLWDAVVGFNAEIDRSIAALLFDFGHLSVFADKTFHKFGDITEPLGVLAMLCHCIRPEHYNLPVDTIVLNLLRLVKISDLVKARHKETFTKFCLLYISDRKELCQTSEFFEFNALARYLKEEKGINLRDVVYKRFCRLLSITLEIYYWRDNILDRLLQRKSASSFNSIHIDLEVLWLQDRNIQELKRSLLGQFAMCKMELQGNRRFVRLPFTLARKFYKGHLRILRNPSLKELYYYKKNPEVSHRLQKLSFSVFSIRPLSLSQWTPDVAQAAMLSHVLFGSIYQG
jgi:hypothetical protein